MLNLFKVTGSSMEPALSDGDFVIATRLYWQLREGDTVVTDHPVYDCIVKRVASVSAHQEITLCGENTNSVSSAAMGQVKTSSIKGKVLFRIRKPQP